MARQARIVRSSALLREFPPVESGTTTQARALPAEARLRTSLLREVAADEAEVEAREARFFGIEGFGLHPVDEDDRHGFGALHRLQVREDGGGVGIPAADD